MRRHSNYQLAMAAVAMLGLTALALSGCRNHSGEQSTTAGQSENSESLRAKGHDASITVLPVGLGGGSSLQVGEALGLLLERGGMTNVEVGAAEFRPPDKADLAQTAEALSAFVRAHPPATDFVLFADFLGAPGKGASEVRSVIVDKQGEVAWQDRQTANDADFNRVKPNEPMTCCMLVVTRLRPVLKLGDPNRRNAPQGKLARQWEEKTGVPGAAEQKAMNERLQVFRKAASTATMIVYPARAGGATNAESAMRLAKLFNDAGLTKAIVLSEGPLFDIKGDMNEQKVLWDMACAFSEHVRANPPDADYALYADYLMGRDAVGAVHFAVCDRHGELVVVDYQNNHHADFNAIKPKSAEDCDRVVLKRLKGYCK